MLRRPKTDFWKVGIVPAPIASLDEASLAALRSKIVWLPPAGPWRYLADPFGLLRGDALHVFVEAFDYRTKHAVIERHELDAHSLSWRGKSTALARDFHLSYPYVFEHQGNTLMVPESHQAGEVALYRAGENLDSWVRDFALIDGVAAADASLIEYRGLWWMFYSIVGPKARDQKELHLAVSRTLDGPWHPVAENPIRVDRGGARPAGRPFLGADGMLMLPVQDSSAGYGSAVRLLRFVNLAPGDIRIEVMPARFTGGLVCDDHVDGFHTLSACGPYTLIDVKRVDRARAKQWLDLKRRLKRTASKLAF